MLLFVNATKTILLHFAAPDSYEIIECPDDESIPAPPLPPPALQRNPSSVGSGVGGRTGAGVWCKRCSQFHDSLFVCPALLGASNAPNVPPQPSGSKSGKGPASDAPGGPPSASGGSSTAFSRLSAQIGNETFKNKFLQKITKEFSSEAELVEYANAFIMAKDAAGLKESLKADLAFGNVEAQTLAGHLFSLNARR